MRMKRIGLSIIMIFALGAALPLGAQERTLQAVRVKVTAEQANLRERPDIGSAVVQQIPEGTVLQADGKEGEWYLVRYVLDDGGVRAGYVHESLVVVTAEAAGPPAKEARDPLAVTPAEPRPKAPAPRPARAPRPAAAAMRPFELSVSLIGGPVDPADLNDGAQGLVAHNAALLGVEPSGSAGAMRLGVGAGLELSYRISPEFAVGLGLDHLRGGTTSRVTYAAELFTETLTVEPAFQATPVKALVRFYPGRGFYLKGGLGAYRAKAGYVYKFDREGIWRQYKGSATAWTFGAEAAFGGDWDVGRNLAVFAEAGFRLARWTGLEGREVFSNFLDETLTEAGTLYFWRQALDASSYPFLFVRGARPSGPEISGARAADINLSGAALRAGLRFRF
jgi:hypothetical protein